MEERQAIYGVLRYSAMEHIPIDEYVIDVLLPDVTGHDHAPTAFLVYIVLWTALYRAEQKRIALSLQKQPGKLAFASPLVCGIYLELMTKVLPSRSLKIAAVPQSALCACITNSTPLLSSSLTVLSTSSAQKVIFIFVPGWTPSSKRKSTTRVSVPEIPSSIQRCLSL